MGVEEKGERAAIAVLSSSTIVGLHWQSVAAAGSGFAGSAPIEGVVELEGLVFSVQKVPAGEDPHRFQIAVASDVPASQGDVDAGDQLFPRASQAVDSRFDVIVAWGDAGFFLPVGTIVGLYGRRFVGRWYNGATAAADAYVGLVVHGVYGGRLGGYGSFLSGEHVVER